MEGFTRSVADWIARTRFDDLPASVVEAVGLYVTDHLGCVLGGTVKESSRIIADLASTWGPPEGRCTVVGREMRTSAPLAALINGTTGHALELDDDHREGTEHCGVAVIPAAFATAEQEGVGGRDLILAVALGYEMMIRVSAAHLGKSPMMVRLGGFTCKALTTTRVPRRKRYSAPNGCWWVAPSPPSASRTRWPWWRPGARAAVSGTWTGRST